MKQLSRFLYGGDYNPEQWPSKVLKKDIQVLKKANINSASVNIFSWALLEPEEGKYDFSKLDKIIDELSKNDFEIVLATSTAAMPAWMFKKYPDVARVDYEGRRHVFGQRHNFCPSSPNYQRLAKNLVNEIAKRYSSNSHIAVWHVNNEYGGNCYCKNCQREFRVWLKNRYQTLDNLNKAWNNNVWSHTIYNWDEIVVPNSLGDAWGQEGSETIVAGLSIDYLRFQSEQLQKLFQMEKRIIRKYDPDTPVTTNFHSLPNKMIDYQKWAKDQDIISYDSYPAYDAPKYLPAFLYDLMRTLKHQPFMLMESTPSQVNWQPYSPLKRPGEMAAIELQAVAHGANTVQFFQLTQAIGGSEKYHGAVIGHSRRTDTRVFREVTELGKKLKKIGPKILSTNNQAKVALIFDWSNFWSYDYVDGISQDFNYMSEILDYYRQFYERNIPVDVISVDDDFNKYDLLVAPVLYMMKSGLDKKINSYVANGGNLITTFMSGMVNESDNIYIGGYPGPLKDVTGIWVEESDAVLPGQQITASFNGEKLNCDLICDLIHPNNAHTLAEYSSEFYRGVPAVTVNNYGNGKAWYIGSKFKHESLTKIISKILTDCNISGFGNNDLEITCREDSQGNKYYFVLNLSDNKKKLPEKFLNYKDIITDQFPAVKIKPWQVLVLTK